jgi:hypothetical protein
MPKISELTTTSDLSGDELVPIVKSGTTQRTTVDAIREFTQFADYTALRAYTGTARSAYVTGFDTSATTSPSGIAGAFTRDDSDTTSADNGGTIIVDSNNTRWKRQYDGPVNVEWFGARGDGVTDDTAAIQAAVDAGEGGTLYFPPGTYLISAGTAAAAIAIPAAGIRLLGAGKYASTLTATVACAFVAGVDADKVEIEHLGFDGQQTTRLAWQRAVLMRGIRDLTVRDCRFYRIGDGPLNAAKDGFGGSDAVANGTRQPQRIRVLDNEFVDCRGTVCVLTKYVGGTDVLARGNYFQDSGTIAVSIESEGGAVGEYAERVVVTDNIINGVSYTYSAGLSAVAYGISVGERARCVVVSNNVIEDVAGDTLAAGVLVGTSPSQDDTEAVNVTVNGNIIRTVAGASGRGWGVLLQAGDTSIGRITVNSNIIDAVEDGIGFDLDAGAKTTGYVENITCVGNVISNVTEIGILSLTVSSSGSLGLRNAVIADNCIIDAASHGMSLKLTDSAINSNVVRSCGGVGLSILSGSGRNTVTANVCHANAGDGISAVGDDTTYTANVCMNNGQGGATSYGIQVTSGANVSLQHNRCEDDQGSPTQDYGIRAPNGSTIRNNELVGNATGTVWGGIAAHNTGTYDAGLNRTA